jgi:ParB family chromosome partitioning protein
MAKPTTTSSAKPTPKRAAKPAAESTGPAPEPTEVLTIETIPEGIHVEFEPFTALIPLSRLRLTELNVRQTERDADVASLAEDIAQRGLKQNLIVSPAHWSTMVAENGETGSAGLFEVTGGGRRTQALKLLATDGRLPADHPVQCRVEPRGEARESSLSENLHRVAMNPADEFTAFDRIAAEQRDRHGASPADAVAYVARRFGVAERHVEQRLRLAALAPEILDALRDGTISLASAKAYAGTADHELQLRIFDQQCKSNWQPHAASIVRDALHQRSLSLNDRLVKFVGIGAYRAAGGRTETDLFMGAEGEERLLDVRLIEDLAQRKAEPLVAPQAAQDGFASGLLAAPGSDKWPKPPEGMERYIRYYQDEDPTEAELAKAIAVYGIDDDGLRRLGHFHTPEPRQEPEQRDWEAERQAQRRAHLINLRSARMAVGPVNAGPLKGTPLEGLAFWPLGHCAAVEQRGEDFVLVAVQIRVPAADVEAQVEEATRLVDKELAEAAAKKAAAEADAAATGDEPEAELEDEDAEA